MSKLVMVIAGVFLVFLMVVVALLGGFITTQALREPGYKVKGQRVYFYYSDHGMTRSIELTHADAESFEILNQRYAKDKSIVYFDGEVIPGCDPATLTLLSDKSLYSRDADAVFHARRKISSNPDHFRVMGAYAADHEYVWDVLGNVIQGADALTFEGLEPIQWGRDAYRVYHNGKMLRGADADTFTPQSAFFGKDNHYGFFENNFIPDSDPASFKVVAHLYAADQNYVYYRNEILLYADPSTFEPVDDGKVYGKDARRVFYQHQEVEGADPETFHTVDSNMLYGEDKNGRYSGAVRVD
jgi:hypothetical protein